jgi:FMN-dependent NADH-azoreductase
MVLMVLGVLVADVKKFLDHVRGAQRIFQYQIKGDIRKLFQT